MKTYCFRVKINKYKQYTNNTSLLHLNEKVSTIHPFAIVHMYIMLYSFSIPSKSEKKKYNSGYLYIYFH